MTRPRRLVAPRARSPPRQTSQRHPIRRHEQFRTVTARRLATAQAFERPQELPARRSSISHSNKSPPCVKRGPNQQSSPQRCMIGAHNTAEAAETPTIAHRRTKNIARLQPTRKNAPSFSRTTHRRSRNQSPFQNRGITDRWDRIICRLLEARYPPAYNIHL
jgi:hypothetical protein